MTPNRNDQDELFPWEKDDTAAMDASAAAPPAPRQRSDPHLAEPLRPGDRRSYVSRDEATDTGVPRDRPVVPREYYSISEVCELVDLKPHVLRYWETQFGPLNPSKNRSGNRVYQKKEIRLILLVKHLLYEEKYTVEGARAKLDQLRRSGRLPDVTAKAMTHDTAALVRNELEQVLEILTPART
jgi:DNA-binding transcriptional MerR regulator